MAGPVKRMRRLVHNRFLRRKAARRARKKKKIFKLVVFGHKELDLI